MRVALKPLLVDLLLAAVLTGLTVATLAEQTRGRVDAIGWTLASLAVAPIALRQTAPVTTTLVIIAALSAYALRGHNDLPSGGVGLLVAMFTVATLRSRAVTAVLYAMTLGLMAIIVNTTTGPVWSQAVQSALIVLGAWVLGESTRRWSHRAERLAARAAEAVAEERVRIARELHDIVAHHMSVISLQAGVADYVLDSDPSTARKAIRTVGQASHEALADLRRLLNVLRLESDRESDYQPQPGLAQLDELVQRSRGAGLPVAVVVTGRPRTLPSGPDLCAYRVIQESLTNVLKHASPATARITIDYGQYTLTVTVTDDGTKAVTSQPPPTSHGIRGMRERAELYGGVLTAGPTGDRGFAVVLRLPLEEPA